MRRVGKTGPADPGSLQHLARHVASVKPAGAAAGNKHQAAPQSGVESDFEFR